MCIMIMSTMPASTQIETIPSSFSNHSLESKGKWLFERNLRYDLCILICNDEMIMDLHYMSYMRYVSMKMMYLSRYP